MVEPDQRHEVPPAHCPRCHLLTIDAWVQQINAKAREIEAWEQSIHPSAWHEQLRPYRDAYCTLAGTPTCDCDQSGIPPKGEAPHV